jgi:hypothetical protein
MEPYSLFLVRPNTLASFIFVDEGVTCLTATAYLSEVARRRQNVDTSERKSGSLSHFHLLSRHLHDGQWDTNASELA